MAYCFTKTLALPFDKAIEVVTEALKAKGFGVLTTIDVKAAFKSKLDVDFRPYTILGACSPRHAHTAISFEDKIGTMLPCNVLLQQKAEGQVEVSAIDPIASMQAISNPKLGEVATEVQGMLKSVIESL